MKNLRYIVLHLTVLALIFSSCDSFNDALDAEEVKHLQITLKAKSILPGVEDIDGLKVEISNHSKGIFYSGILDGDSAIIENVLPGLYSVSFEGEAYDVKGDKFLMKGALVNHPIYNEDLIETTVSGLRDSKLVFKEIFYAGSPTFYFRNQFYEVYNMGEEIIYLDGIYFANLTPGTATTKLPTWPEADGDNYAYAERVWKFPGEGADYPLAPGESCIISQFAANHQLPQYNPNSPVNCFSSEFEFNMNNPNFPDQPAYDMLHVFYNGLAEMGGIPQYLTSVFGGAYVIFKPLEGEVYDPVGDKSLSTTDLSSVYATLYAKIPITYILDAVEAGNNASMLAAKRVPSVLDAGMTWVGKNYNSLGVARKLKERTPEGVLILEDTNNSTNDFEIVTPELRRYGSKMPSWNHTLQSR